MKDVLITGGTGSLGQALTATLLQRPGLERLIIFSRDELKQAQMAERFPDPRIRWALGDVRDYGRLLLALRGVDTVIHAAALKRVDAIAYNPSEVMRTNIEGTHNVCLAAIACGCARVLTISSDKACLPTNIYGISKAFAESLTISANSYAGPDPADPARRATALACVRYGNVLGSRGSVVHLWRAARDAGRPLRLTDAEMTRFCMTLAEACQLILWTLTHMRGGETVVPALPTMCLSDLAEAVAPGHPVEIVGWRPGGEKLHEAMASGDELARATVQGWPSRESYIVIRPHLHSWTAQWPWDGEAPWERLLPLGLDGYTSDQNPDVLSVEQLRLLLQAVP